MNPTIKRLWRLRRVRAGLILLGAALFVAVAVAYVDWTGARRLEEAREMVAREGESLDMHASAPDPLEAANHPGEPPIPLDIVSGKPMGYRKTQDGRYILWCVSFSGVDHGGRRVLDKLDPGHTRFTAPNYQGDWVWSFQEAAN